MKKTIVAILLAACGFISLADNVVYVSPSGNDANPGTSSSRFRTINAALAALEAKEDIDTEGGTIYLADGTYSEEMPQYPLVATWSNSAVVVTHPISIEGESGDPSKVIVKRQSSDLFRVFYLNHAGSAVRNLTVTGGEPAGKPGGGFLVDSAGGTVENCIVTACKSGNYTTAEGGGGVCLRGGRVARTIVSNCQTGNIRQYGAGIYASAGLIDNCLVTGCSTAHHKSSSNGNSAVLLSGTAKMVNSTVTKNTSCLVSGVWINSTNAQAVNCAVYGNTLCSSTHPDGCTRFSGCFATATNPGTTVYPQHTKNLGDIYVNCASESEPYLTSCVKLTSSPFTNYEGSDYTHGVDSPLANAGNSSLARSISQSAEDLYGNDRYSGTSVDIGAYELPQGFSVVATPDRFKMSLSDSGVVNFTTETGGAAGDVSYYWVFGDGATLQTSAKEVAHEYTTPGHYTVSVTAYDGSSYVTYEIPYAIDVYGISFTCSVSAPTIVTNRTVSFTVSDVSTAEAMTYRWDFGDGVRLTTTGTAVEHAYSSPGSYNVSVYGVSETAGDYEFSFSEPIRAITRDLYADASNAHSAEPTTPGAMPRRV